MSPSRILIGQFLIVMTIIVLTIWGATQWTAHELGYQRGARAALIFGERGLDRRRIAELWRVQTEKPDPWQVSA